MSFSQLRISSSILKGLKDGDIVTPSPLHKKIINSLKAGGDLLVVAPEDENSVETGYLVPVLDSISRLDRREGTRAVIIAPDPERASTIADFIRTVGQHAEIGFAAIEESGDRSVQRSLLAAGPSVIIGTSERLSEIMEESRMIFRETGFLVIDRADRMDSWESVEKIRQRILGKCRHIVTATGDAELNGKLDFMNTPDRVEAGSARSTTQSVDDTDPREIDKTNPHEIEITRDLTQYYIKVPPRMKISTLMAHMDNNPEGRVLVFTASRRTADRLYRVFRKSGRRAVSLHGELDRKIFDERFDRFRQGQVDNLIAGDISASELPVDQVTQVINYDVPEDVLEYKLRADLIGDGKAARIVSLVSRQDRSDIEEISKELGFAPEEIPLPEAARSRASKGRGRGPKQNSQKQASHKQTRNQRSGSRSDRSRPGRRSRDVHEPAHTGSAGLPRPSYDKLSGGRSGERKEKESSGIVGFFKKLFNQS